MALEPETLLNNRYRIIDILGQGGMGSVYRAVDENLGMEVAVKENLFTTDEYARQFRLEAVILASLRHPNMPRVTDHYVIETEGQYLVMDYIEGEDLRQRMERMGTITEEDAILIGAAICDALSYLHTRKPPVLHRDIKPGNVKVTPEGQVYLVDFGLAKLIQGSQTTTTGARAMTPGYSPPEQYGTARTDPRSDIYSLGATLYAALTGVIPEDGLARVMDNLQLTPIRKHNPNVSRRLATAIEKAMEAYPDERFQTADEFRKALLSTTSKTQRLLDMPVAMTVSPPPTEASTPATPGGKDLITPVRNLFESVTSGTTGTSRRRRNSHFGSVGLWVSALFLITTIYLLWQTNALPGILASALPPGVAQTYIPSIVEAATEEPFQLPDLIDNPGDEQNPAPSPSASITPPPPPTETPVPTPTVTPLGGGTGQIAFASTRTGIPQIFIMYPDRTGLFQVTNEQDGACQPDWSPDGMRIVYVSPCPGRQDQYPNSSLYVVNADGTGRISLPTTLGGDFDPAWSPDGKRIAFTSLRGETPDIYILNLDTNLVSQITKAQSISASRFARYPAWNPFGTQIVYAMRRASGMQIWVTTDSDINVSKPNVQIVQSDVGLSDYQPVWSPDGEFIVFNQTNADRTAPAWLMRIRYEDRLSKRAVRVPIEPLPVANVSFSPDGFWLIFESWPDNSGNKDIYMATVTGANRQRVSTDPGVDFDPVWRPIPRVMPPTPTPSPTPLPTDTPEPSITPTPTRTATPTRTPSPTHTP